MFDLVSGDFLFPISTRRNSVMVEPLFILLLSINQVEGLPVDT